MSTGKTPLCEAFLFARPFIQYYYSIPFEKVWVNRLWELIKNNTEETQEISLDW